MKYAVYFCVSLSGNVCFAINGQGSPLLHRASIFTGSVFGSDGMLAMNSIFIGSTFGNNANKLDANGRAVRQFFQTVIVRWWQVRCQ